jgi:hypothetical protein
LPSPAADDIRFPEVSRTASDSFGEERSRSTGHGFPYPAIVNAHGAGFHGRFYVNTGTEAMADGFFDGL